LLQNGSQGFLDQMFPIVNRNYDCV
jgi:hypothetical protein